MPSATRNNDILLTTNTDGCWQQHESWLGILSSKRINWNREGLQSQTDTQGEPHVQTELDEDGGSSL